MNKQIKVALLGLGIVGSGVANAIITKSEYIKKHLGVSVFIESVLVRDRRKSRNVVLSNSVYVDSIDDILDNPEIDVVIEVMGGESPALDYILQAIKKFRKGDWKNCYSEKVTALSWLVVPEVLSVHEMPSEDVIMVPLAPTTTYNSFP